MRIPFTNVEVSLRAFKTAVMHPANAEAWRLFSSGRDTASSIDVDEAIALTFETVYSCVKILAESFAILPGHILLRDEEGNRSRAREYFLYTLVHDAPNEEHTASEFWSFIVASRALWGNAYAQKIMDQGGRLRALWPLYPGKMTVQRKEGKLEYTYRDPSAGERLFRSDEIFHVKNLVLDGVTGQSPVALLRNSIGEAMAAQDYASRFWSNSARPDFILSRPIGAPPLKEQAIKNLREAFEDRHQGTEHAHRLGIVEYGTDVKVLGMPLKDAEMLASRQFKRGEIASIWRIPPYKINEMGRATWGNLKEQKDLFYTEAMLPIIVSIEQAISRDLIPVQDRSVYYAKFDADAILRGNAGDRWDEFTSALEHGALCINDVLELMDRNKVAGGDVRLVPANYVPLTMVEEIARKQTEKAKEPVTQSQPEKTPQGERMRPVLLDAAQRIIKRERQDIADGSRRFIKSADETAFDAWWIKQRGIIEDFAHSALTPAYAAMGSTGEVATLTARHLFALDSRMKNIAGVPAALEYLDNGAMVELAETRGN